MSGACVIGMTVGDDRTFDWSPGVDVKVTWPAVQSFRPGDYQIHSRRHLMRPVRLSGWRDEGLLGFGQTGEMSVSAWRVWCFCRVYGMGDACTPEPALPEIAVLHVNILSGVFLLSCRLFRYRLFKFSCGGRCYEYGQAGDGQNGYDRQWAPYGI